MMLHEVIEELREALPGEDHDRTWALVQMIEGDLDRDPRTSKQERETLRSIKATVSDYFAAKREGLHAHESIPGAHIGFLLNSILRRTTGPDGWPLAR